MPDSSPILNPTPTPRGVDKSTYCDYQLTFLLHIHGLPLSAKRALLILMVSGYAGAALLGEWGSQAAHPCLLYGVSRCHPACLLAW